MKQLKEPLVDVAVLLIFFSRPEQFSEVFKQVKKARPSKLFLYQDGPREGRKSDIEGINKCRKIAEDIDWECEVHKFYQDKNVGCDPSEYISQKWAFSFVDKCIVLEDDDVPSVSFFTFCKELLDKYEYDTRITMISGFNHEEITKDNPYDYLFTSNVSIWGWASWKRVIDQWDENYRFLDDEFNLKKLKSVIDHRKYIANFISMSENHKAQKKASYETILISNHLLNNGLSIVPTRNMINNIGVTADSTHFSGDINSIAKGLKRIFTMKRYEIQGPLKHPKYIMEDYEYKERVFRIMAWRHPIIKIYRTIEESIYRIKSGDLKGTFIILKNKFSKFISKQSY